MIGRKLSEIERDAILETLAHCHGNRTHAATTLDVSLRCLRMKLNEYAAQGFPITPSSGRMVT